MDINSFKFKNNGRAYIIDGFYIPKNFITVNGKVRKNMRKTYNEWRVNNSIRKVKYFTSV